MEEPRSHEVTGLLQAWSAGDEEALQELTSRVYQELHRAARRYMAGERPSHTLQATALINEVYVRLIDAKRMDWQNHTHLPIGITAAKIATKIPTVIDEMYGVRNLGWIFPAHSGSRPSRDRKSTRLNSSHLGISYAV